LIIFEIVPHKRMR